MPTGQLHWENGFADGINQEIPFKSEISLGGINQFLLTV